MTLGLELIIVVVVALGAVALHRAIQRRYDAQWLSRHNDVAGFLLSVVGVIYAVVLGFVVVVVWEKYDDALGYVDNEIAAAIDLYHASEGLPLQLRNAIRADLRSYATVVVTQEWPEMRRGELALNGAADLESISYSIESFAPVTMQQSNAQQAAQYDVRRLFDARRQRIRENLPSVPAVLWFALISGAIATLGFAYLFGVENRGAQLVMTAILAGVIAIMFIVINEFDYPFRGAVAIQSSGWNYVTSRITFIDRNHW